LTETTIAGGFDPDEVEVLGGHFIDGRFVTGADRSISVLRPSDCQRQGEIPVADEHRVAEAVSSAARAQPAWAALRPRERAVLMQRWADLAEQHVKQLAMEESLVSARIYAETISVDSPAAANWIRYYAEYADKLEGSITATAPECLSLVTNEPYGVIGAIAPWNFPLVLAIWKAAPAMAAGNSVVLKPSELTPYSITRLASLAVEAGIPPGVFNIVHGEGQQTGRALVRHPQVNYVAFTGSTATGAAIMADAAHSGIKPVSLELGGKSPQLVFADGGDLDVIADNVAWGLSRNSGQLCYAGTRLVVHRDVSAPLMEKIAARLSKLVAGPTWQAETTLAPIASAAQLERLELLLQQTLEQGARIYAGGESFTSKEGGHFFTPTIVAGLEADMVGYTDEFFGPILGVQEFTDDAEGIRLAQHPHYGLSASVYSQNIDRALHAARALQAGTVWINSWGRKPDMSAPFGGYKQSGFGKEAGRAGIEKFLRNKSIWIDIKG
jgi:aldehyde dehydrogenase (NAD+)